MDGLPLQIPCAVGYSPQSANTALSTPPPRHRSDGVKHFMPLSNGKHPMEGPNKSIFSKPTFSYSPDTDAFISQLMKESRLTFRQRTGFESILRSGTPLPPHPSDILRQDWARARHAQKARRLGMPVLPPHPQHKDFSHAAQLYAKFGGGGRRTLESIRSEAKSAAPPPRRSYNPPVDHELEKDRLAHRMATGKDPPPKELIVQGMNRESLKESSDPSEARFQELVGEVEDRLDFVEQSVALGAGGAETTLNTISTQIQELLTEMRGISVERTNGVMTLLGVEETLQNARDRVGGRGRRSLQPKGEMSTLLKQD